MSFLVQPFGLARCRHLFTPLQVCPHFLWFHRLKSIHHDNIKGVNAIVSAAPPATPLVALLLITSALVICVRCLRRPDRVEHVPPLFQDNRQTKTKVMYHRASVNGIKEHSGRPNGHIRRPGDADCRARRSSYRLTGLVEEVACKPFLLSVCI